jgi:hypothetical protein
MRSEALVLRGTEGQFRGTPPGRDIPGAEQLKPLKADKILCLNNFLLVKQEQFAKMGIEYGDRGLLPNNGFCLGHSHARDEASRKIGDK